MADLGFTRGGTNSGGAKLLFGIIFAENYMEMKKIWTERGRTSYVPLDPPLNVTKFTDLKKIAAQESDRKREIVLY